MATKRKKRKERQTRGGRRELAHRALEKGNVKQAYKDAKVCYRDDPSEDHRQLYQRACFARAKELARMGHREESRSVLRTLLELGETEGRIQQELPELLVSVGMCDRLPSVGDYSAVEEESPLLRRAADHAVLRPEEAPTSPPLLRQGARQVRAALEALEGDDQSQALAHVRNIARSSPFADWRLFVRGLAAYYRKDVAEMRAAWNRLDPGRMAARIAGPLGNLADPVGGGAQANGSHQAATFRVLEKAVFGEPVWSCLQQLRLYVATQRWGLFLSRLKRSRSVLENVDPELYARLGMVAYTNIARKGLVEELGTLKRTLSPPPMDPHWNRVQAIAWEQAEDGDVDEAEGYWRAYLKDLAEIPGFSPEERKRAQALVWQHMGNLCALSAKAEQGRPFGADDDYVEELQEQAEACYREAVKRDPTLISCYRSLAALQDAKGDADGAAGTRRELLERHPDDLDALLRLADHFRRADDPLTARRYVERARQLKPTNPEIAQFMWWVHIASARHHAMERRWEEGRAELEAAAQVDPSSKDAVPLLVRRAVFELKARNFELGEQLAERAQQADADPAAARLALAIESIRYDLSRTAQKGFERLWREMLKKKKQSRAAGNMSELMDAYVKIGVFYPGRNAHIQSIVEYLQRCRRVKWQEEDLRNVCLFLATLLDRDEYSGDWRFPERLVRQGVKKFPDSAVFHLLAGELEIDKGPLRCKRRYAYDRFQRVMELCRTARDSEHEDYARRAKRSISLLEEVGLHQPPRFAMPPSPSPFGSGPSLPVDIESMIDDICRARGIDREELFEELTAELAGAAAAAGPPNGRGKRHRRAQR